LLKRFVEQSLPDRLRHVTPVLLVGHRPDLGPVQMDDRGAHDLLPYQLDRIALLEDPEVVADRVHRFTDDPRDLTRTRLLMLGEHVKDPLPDRMPERLHELHVDRGPILLRFHAFAHLRSRLSKNCFPYLLRRSSKPRTAEEFQNRW